MNLPQLTRTLTKQKAALSSWLFITVREKFITVREKFITVREKFITVRGKREMCISAHYIHIKDLK